MKVTSSRLWKIFTLVFCTKINKVLSQQTQINQIETNQRKSRLGTRQMGEFRADYTMDVIKKVLKFVDDHQHYNIGAKQQLLLVIFVFCTSYN